MYIHKICVGISLCKPNVTLLWKCMCVIKWWFWFHVIFILIFHHIKGNLSVRNVYIKLDKGQACLCNGKFYNVQFKNAGKHK